MIYAIGFGFPLASWSFAAAIQIKGSVGHAARALFSTYKKNDRKDEKLQNCTPQILQYCYIHWHCYAKKKNSKNNIKVASTDFYVKLVLLSTKTTKKIKWK